MTHSIVFFLWGCDFFTRCPSFLFYLVPGGQIHPLLQASANVPTTMSQSLVHQLLVEEVTGSNLSPTPRHKYLEQGVVPWPINRTNSYPCTLQSYNFSDKGRVIKGMVSVVCFLSKYPIVGVKVLHPNYQQMIPLGSPNGHLNKIEGEFRPNELIDNNKSSNETQRKKNILYVY